MVAATNGSDDWKLAPAGFHKRSAAQAKIVLPRPEKVIEQPIAVERRSLGICSDR